MKKIVTLILALVLCLSLFVSPVWAEEEAPTEVATLAQLLAMEANGNYILTADIDFTDATWNVGGYVIADFSGKLDGNGHSFLNINYTNTSVITAPGGIFSTLGANGETEICNLTIGSSNQPATLNLTGSATNIYGLLAGKATTNKVTLNGVTVYGNLVGLDQRRITYAGLLLGDAYSETVINNCKTYGSVKGLTTTADKKPGHGVCAGGMVGYADGTGTLTVSNSVNFANVSGDYNRDVASRLFLGGFLGLNAKAVTFTNCSNFGSVSKANEYEGVTYLYPWFGGFLGAAWANDTFENCSNFGAITSTSGTNPSVGGLIGNAQKTQTATNCFNYGVLTGGAEPATEYSGNGALYGSLDSCEPVITNCLTETRTVNAVSDSTLSYCGYQLSEIKDNAFGIRFVSTIASLDYASVGFLVKAYYVSNGVLQEKTYNVTCKHVYEEIIGYGVDYTAEALGGEYISALAVTNVPATVGPLTFIVTPFAVQGEATVYGASACVVTNGAVSPAQVTLN